MPLEKMKGLRPGALAEDGAELSQALFRAVAVGAGGKEGNIRILTLGGGPSVCLKTPAKTGLGERFHRVALPSPADAGTSPYFRSIPRGNTTPGCLAADSKVYSQHRSVCRARSTDALQAVTAAKHHANPSWSRMFAVPTAPTRSKPSPRPSAMQPRPGYECSPCP